MTAPVLLIGTAISTAVFPRLNNRLSSGRPDLFRQDYIRYLRLIIWISLPVAVICYFGRGYLARLIFTRDSGPISQVFGYLTFAILFNTLYAILSRWFYAQKDTRTPLYISVFTISLNIVLAFWLGSANEYGLQGLAIAQSIAGGAEVFVLCLVMFTRDNKIFDTYFWSGVFRTLSVTGFSLLAGYITIGFLPLGADDRGFVTLGTKVFALAAVTMTTHLVVSGIFGLEEAQPFWKWVRHLLYRPVKVEY